MLLAQLHFKAQYACYQFALQNCKEIMKMAEPLFDPKNISLVMTDEYAATLNVMPLYSIGTILMFYAIGFLGFKRKAIR